MLSRICLETASHHTFHNHFNFLASHCTAPFSTAQATGNTGTHWQHWHFRGFLAHSSRPQQPPTAAAHLQPPQQPPQQPPHSSRPPAAAPAAAHSSRPSSRLSIFSLISRPFYPPTAARGGFRGILPNYAPFQSFPSYLDRSRAFGSMGALSKRHYWLYGGLWGGLDTPGGR